MIQSAFEPTENRQKQNDCRTLSLLPKCLSPTSVTPLLPTWNQGLSPPLTLKISNHGLVEIYFHATRAGSYLCRG